MCLDLQTRIFYYLTLHEKGWVVIKPIFFRRNDEIDHQVVIIFVMIIIRVEIGSTRKQEQHLVIEVIWQEQKSVYNHSSFCYI